MWDDFKLVYIELSESQNTFLFKYITHMLYISTILRYLCWLLTLYATFYFYYLHLDIRFYRFLQIKEKIYIVIRTIQQYTVKTTLMSYIKCFWYIINIKLKMWLLNNNIDILATKYMYKMSNIKWLKSNFECRTFSCDI